MHEVLCYERICSLSELKNDVSFAEIRSLTSKGCASSWIFHYDIFSQFTVF